MCVFNLSCGSPAHLAASEICAGDLTGSMNYV